MRSLMMAITAAGLLSLCASAAHAQNVNAQSGTTYTFVNADCGFSRTLVTFSNASAVAVTLPQAGATNLFIGGCTIRAENLGAGQVTITPTTSTINGKSSIVLDQNQSVEIQSDSTGGSTGNYWALFGGLFQADNQTIVTKSSGVSSTSVPAKTVTTSYTVTAADMGGIVNFNGTSLTVTFPAATSTILAIGMSIQINNQNSSAVTITNSSGLTLVGFSGTTIPQYGGISCVVDANGTQLDCVGIGGT